MRFYSNVYFSDINNYLTSRERGDAMLQAKAVKPQITNESDKSDNQADKKEVDTNIPGGELYFMLKDFLKQRLAKIAEVSAIK